MGRVIVIQFSSADGVVEDPDGSDGTPFGGWAMRHGPEAIAGDKFRLGPIMADGTLVFGRRTWDHFGRLWSLRDTPFARAMNAATKAVVTHRDADPAAWVNSTRIDAALVPWVEEQRSSTDLVVIGSGSVVQQLEAADLIDEIRLLVFPIVLVTGRRLLTAPARLTLQQTDREGPATLSVYSTRD